MRYAMCYTASAHVLRAQSDIERDGAKPLGQDHLVAVIMLVFHAPDYWSMYHYPQPLNGESRQQLVWVHVDTSISLFMHSKNSPILAFRMTGVCDQSIYHKDFLFRLQNLQEFLI